MLKVQKVQICTNTNPLKKSEKYKYMLKVQKHIKSTHTVGLIPGYEESFLGY